MDKGEEVEFWSKEIGDATVSKYLIGLSGKYMDIDIELDREGGFTVGGGYGHDYYSGKVSKGELVKFHEHLGRLLGVGNGNS